MVRVTVMNEHYQITFRLASPVVFTDPPLFDAMIALCWAHDQEKQDRFDRLSIPENELLDFSAMPIAKSEHGYFLASQMFGAGDHEQVIYKRKKWEDAHDHLADFGKHKRKVRITAATYKSYELPYVMHTFESPHPNLAWSPFGHVWFYFVGECGKVLQLIDKHLVGIGKSVYTGKGAFSDLIIEKLNTEFVPERMRPVPVESFKGGFMMKTGKSVKFKFMPPSPPYWDSRRAVRHVMVSE